MAFTDFESVAQTFKKTKKHTQHGKNKSLEPPQHNQCTIFYLGCSPRIMIGSVLQHSQPYRSRTSGGILRTESWHQPVGLQQTGLKSHIYTYQTAHDLSPKKHFFKHPKQHPVSANEHDKTSKDIKNIQRFQEISSDISANERFIANIFAIYISELALSRVPPCFLYFSILHFVA